MYACSTLNVTLGYLTGFWKHVLTVSVRHSNGTGKSTLRVCSLKVQVDIGQLRQQLFWAPVELQWVLHLELSPFRT